MKELAEEVGGGRRLKGYTGSKVSMCREWQRRDNVIDTVWVRRKLLKKGQRGNGGCRPGPSLCG